jgi:citrate synthase
MLITALLVSFCSLRVAGYAQSPEETDASVPALNTFHEVIYKIWHEAWPNKNIAMLQNLSPDVEKGIAEVAGAKLPGILRDKKAAWDGGVQKLQAVGEEYKAAVAAKDDTKLMAAAELLHSRFEQLMRAIRPPLEELEAFHAVLYMLYHHYLPKFDLETIRKATAELTQKMAVLNNARLSERRKDKDPDFQSKRAQLSESVTALETIVKAGDQKAVKDAMEKVHSNYQALEHIF